MLYEELKTKYGDKFEEQLKLESVYKKLGYDYMFKTIHNQMQTDASNTKMGRNLTSHALTGLADVYTKWLTQKTTKRSGVKAAYVGVLQDLLNTFKDPNAVGELLAISTLTTTLSLVQGHAGEAVVNNTAIRLIKEINQEYRMKQFLNYLEAGDNDKEKENQKKIFLAGLRDRVSPYYRRKYMDISMQKDSFIATEIPMLEGIQLATQLIYLASETTGYFSIKPNGERGVLVLTATMSFIKAWERSEQTILDHSYKLCPTIIPPKPWESFNEGGYYGDLSPSCRLLRLKRMETSFGNAYMQKLKQANISPVINAVNAIQATPWKINKDVLNVMSYLMEQGGGQIEALPVVDEQPPIVLSEEPTQEELERYKEVMPKWYKQHHARLSKYLRALSVINESKHFVNYDKIYFPCNMDFRGRIYPIPPFNPQGDDLTKSMLLFAEVPPFSREEDFNKLMILGANLAGVDKVSYADRIKWVQDNQEAILAVAKDPLGTQWWHDKDSPCQFLAWCLEYVKALSYHEEHGTYVGFVTGIPFAQDGTCSGLQHFSAILRDPVGGAAVNLVPNEKPNDIYAKVAEAVNELLKVDIQNGTPDRAEDGRIIYGTKTLAQLWTTRGVDRKVTKRPTMTLAYGAKEYGYRDQILEDTIKDDIDKLGDACVFNDYNKWKASAYMADLIWKSVKTVVVKAVEGMAWLQSCATLATQTGKAVTWTTPLGLPLQQNYVKVDSKVVQMKINGRQIRIYLNTFSGELDKTAQRNGIAPNFIHSMDACHLQLTVNRCVDKGIHHFAMIHDSYGCPVSQANLMGEVVREAFYDLYTDFDVLESFKEDIGLLVDSHKIPDLPTKGTLDLSVVKASPYIFC